MRPPLGRLAVLTLFVLAAACAPGMRHSRRDRDVLTQQEMEANNFIKVYDAVQALHSNWLNVHPNTLTATQADVVVYFDGTRLGGPDELKNLFVKDVVYVQHYDPVSATQRYGVGHSQGAILVSTHPR